MRVDGKIGENVLMAKLSVQIYYIHVYSLNHCAQILNINFYVFVAIVPQQIECLVYARYWSGSLD